MLKRLALCLAVLSALSAAARADGALCVTAPGLAALTDASGTDLIPSGSLEDVFTVREGALYAAGSRGAYRLYDADGRALGDEEFAMIDDEGDALVFRRGGFYGAMNARGEVILDAQWTQLTGDGAGGWLALDGDPLDELADEIIHLSAAGVEKRTGVYTASALERLGDGRMPYMASDGLYGAIDGEGNVAIEPRWRFVGSFEYGLAKVSGAEGSGLIDADGRVVVPPVYAWLERGATMIAAGTGERMDVYAPDGSRRRFSIEGEGMEAALAGDCLWLTEGERCRLYDAEGTLLLEGEAGLRFAPGLHGQLIACDGAWGEACQWLVDPDGTPASGRLQQILPLCADRYAWLEMDGIEYYSAELGGLQRSWDYGSLRYGLMDGAGTSVLPARYSEIRALGEDRLLLVSESAVQIADLDGTVLRTWITAEDEAPSAEAGA